MVAQLIRQDDGSYDYVQVGPGSPPRKTVAPNVAEFEAYEGAKKGGDELVSAPSITEQTETITREIPGQVVFDEKTGQFITKKAKAIDLEYKPGDITPESTEPTALEKVMKMSEGTRVEQPDYKQIMKDAYQATRPSWKEQALGKALDVGGNILTNYITKKMTGAAGDFAVNYMTQNVLGKTMAGRLATSGMMQGGMVNPYVAGGMMLMKSGAGKKIAKTVKKVGKSVIDFVTGGTVICTELCRQGYISNEDLKLHWKYTINKFTKDQMKGYWVWGLPVAKKMKTNKILTKIWFHIMKYRLKDVRYNIGKGKFSLLGKLYSFILENGSLLISKLIKNKKTKEVFV